MSNPLLADLQARVLGQAPPPSTTAPVPAVALAPPPPVAPAPAAAPGGAVPLGVLVPISVKGADGEITVQALFGPEHLAGWDALLALLDNLQASGVPLKVWPSRGNDRGFGGGGGGGGGRFHERGFGGGGGGGGRFGGGGGGFGGRRGW